MAGDGATDEHGLVDRLPPEAADWVEERADEADLGSEELLARLVAAHRAVESDGEGAAPPTADRVADVEAAVENLQADLDDKIDDVRSRVVQVKREADAKADASHDHPSLSSELDAVADRAAEAATAADEAAAAVEDLDERTAALEEWMDDVAASVDDAADDAERAVETATAAEETATGLEDKTTTLARALIALREQVRSLSRTAEERSAVDDLKRRANREGVRAATCEDCDGRIEVGLLTEPACPHCAATLSDVEPKTGLFGSHTLVTGDPPALEPGDADVSDDALRELSKRGDDDD